VDKVVGLQEAAAELVKDGASIALEGFTHLIPTAAAHEIIRQKRRAVPCPIYTPGE
jgi:glutaconate CoA-transferase subunit A